MISIIISRIIRWLKAELAFELAISADVKKRDLLAAGDIEGAKEEAKKAERLWMRWWHLNRPIKDEQTEDNKEES